MTNLRSQFLDKLMSIYAFNSQEFSSADMSKALGEALREACDLGYFDSRILVEAMQGGTAVSQFNAFLDRKRASR